jgi:chromosome segregation ATPase
MGLIRKKGRSDKRASDGRSDRSMESTADRGSWKPAEPAEGATREAGVDDTREAAFPSELRLAVEAVAEGADAAGGGSGSDAYGLRAELQASRRRGDGDHEGAHSEGEELAPTEESMPMLVVSREQAADDGEAKPEAVAEPEPDVAIASDVTVGLVDIDERLAGDPWSEQTPQPAETAEPSSAGEQQDAPTTSTGSFATEARARLDALERSLLEKTEALRERAAELTERESALAKSGDDYGELESRFADRQHDLEAREEALRAEAERLEQEQAIWGEATRESRTKLAELQEALDAKEKELGAKENQLAELAEAHETRSAELDRHDRELKELGGKEKELAAKEKELAAKEKELAELAEAHASRGAELDRHGAELDARADRISVAEDELAARARELDEREALRRASEDAVEERERRLSERDTAIAGREAALDQTEAGVAEREGSFGHRENELAAREEAVAAERTRLERDRAEWEETMKTAFSRLNELETDLVSSLSLAGMLKRELEGREPNERRERKTPSAQPEPEERHNPRAIRALKEAAPVLAALESNGSSIPKGETGAEQQAAETDWWARQLGRRKKA